MSQRTVTVGDGSCLETTPFKNWNWSPQKLHYLTGLREQSRVFILGHLNLFKLLAFDLFDGSFQDLVLGCLPLPIWYYVSIESTHLSFGYVNVLWGYDETMVLSNRITMNASKMYTRILFYLFIFILLNMYISFRCRLRFWKKVLKESILDFL